MHYLGAAVIVFGVNLMPAFGPPTWAVLALLLLTWHLNAGVLVVLGALAACAGRYVLARATRGVRRHLSQERRDTLASTQQLIAERRTAAVWGVALFALSPLPSAQLFEAAGLLAMPLVRLTVAFFAGRVVSYTIYVSTVALAQHSYGEVMTSALRSPWGIALQVVLLVGLVALARIDIRAIVARHRLRRHTHERG